jgi:anti-sigma factor ChrR (cupin superfamily)
MTAPLPPRLRRPATRLGAAVVRIACPECGRELASATYGVRALLELHEPTCEGNAGTRAGDPAAEVVAPVAD